MTTLNVDTNFTNKHTSKHEQDKNKRNQGREYETTLLLSLSLFELDLQLGGRRKQTSFMKMMMMVMRPMSQVATSDQRVVIDARM